MSGIFDLFSGTGTSAKEHSSFGPTDSVTKLTTPLPIPGKNVDVSRNKPRGLSIRSKSELNVPLSNIDGRKSPSKSPHKGQYLKAEIEKLIGSPRSLSPRSKEKSAKLQTLKSKQLKVSLSKSKSPDNILSIEETQAEGNLFRKPYTPAKMKKQEVEIYPEPDILANYYDEKEDLHSFTNVLDQEFVRLMALSKNSVKPYEDEGFESDPEFITLAPSSNCSIIVNPYKEEELIVETPALPSLSDDDDDDF